MSGSVFKVPVASKTRKTRKAVRNRSEEEVGGLEVNRASEFS